MSGVHRVPGSEWGPAWADAVRHVIEEATRADGQPPVDEAVELMLANHGLEHAELWVSGPEPAAVRAFALAHWRDGTDTGPTSLDLVTAPEARRQGLAGALSVAALATRPDPWTAWSHGDHPAARRLAQHHGFAATRSLWVMRLAPEVAVPSGEVPDGTRLRGFRPDADTDIDGVVAVNAAAFADHPEQGAMDRAGLLERAAQPWFDPEGLIVAEREGEVVGFHWTKAHPASAGRDAHGEVYVIGVSPTMQGSGLGSALLGAGIDHLRDRGLGEVVLYVESDNPAVRLYERLGFTHADDDTHVQFTRG